MFDSADCVWVLHLSKRRTFQQVFLVELSIQRSGLFYGTHEYFVLLVPLGANECEAHGSREATCVSEWAFPQLAMNISGNLI